MSNLIEASEPKFRWWYLPSWIGLDAPFVVSTWTIAVASSTKKDFSWLSIAALFLTVWAIYLADRIVDVARCRDWSNVTGRMQFGRKFFRGFLLAFLGAALSFVAIVFSGRVFEAVMHRGFFTASFLCIHVVLFVAPVVFRVRLPGKEISVGLFFALGAATVLGANLNSLCLLLGVWLLVAYNCLVIACRDRETDAKTDPSGAGNWWSTIERDLFWIGIVLSVTATSLFNTSPPFAISLVSSFALLTCLHRFAGKFSDDSVRALADYALLTPCVWFAMTAAGTRNYF